MWKPRFKFSLRTLLVCTTLVAVYFCAAQLRRQNILKLAEEFELEGATVQVRNQWIDALWMRQPTDATITTTTLPNGFVRLGLKAFSSSNVQAQTTDLARRLRAVGIERVRLVHDVGARSQLYSFTATENLQISPWVKMRLPNQSRKQSNAKDGCYIPQ
jgi:hypothetical protein